MVWIGLSLPLWKNPWIEEKNPGVSSHCWLELCYPEVMACTAFDLIISCHLWAKYSLKISCNNEFLSCFGNILEFNISRSKEVKEILTRALRCSTYLKEGSFFASDTWVCQGSLATLVTTYFEMLKVRVNAYSLVFIWWIWLYDIVNMKWN